MAWIESIDQPEPGSDLERIYREQTQQAGAVANVLKIHSLAPHVLAAHLEMYRAAMHSRGALSQADREMIAVAVSWTNRCHY